MIKAVYCCSSLCDSYTCVYVYIYKIIPSNAPLKVNEMKKNDMLSVLLYNNVIVTCTLFDLRLLFD